MDAQTICPLIIGGLLNTHFDFCVGSREPYQHVTRGVPLCGLMCIHAFVSRSPWGNGSVAPDRRHSMNEFTLFVDFCLIPLSKNCSFDVPVKKL